MDGFRPERRVGGTGSQSPFAVGHIVNHPSRGVVPNVGWQEFSWEPQDVASSLAANRLHTGLWYFDPATGEPVDIPSGEGSIRLPLPGVAIVSLRSIEPGEELYMDY